MKQVQAIVLTGYGINCEKEMAVACELAGATAEIVHTASLLNRSIDLKKYHMLLLPGGFSFGDELGAGKVFANRLTFSYRNEKESLSSQLKKFVKNGGCILGICNGFQLLVKLGLLPGTDQNSLVASLTYNDSCRFENRWCFHKVNNTSCIFTKNLKKIHLPLRHGEGKFIVQNKETLNLLKQHHQIVFQYADNTGIPSDAYPANPNGSLANIAGITDSTGRILGMMAHPEAALFRTCHPDWMKEKERAKRNNTMLPEFGDGLSIFQNAVEYLKENL